MDDNIIILKFNKIFENTKSIYTSLLALKVVFDVYLKEEENRLFNETIVSYKQFENLAKQFDEVSNYMNLFSDEYYEKFISAIEPYLKFCKYIELYTTLISYYINFESGDAEVNLKNITSGLSKNRLILDSFEGKINERIRDIENIIDVNFKTIFQNHENQDLNKDQTSLSTNLKAYYRDDSDNNATLKEQLLNEKRSAKSTNIELRLDEVEGKINNFSQALLEAVNEKTNDFELQKRKFIEQSEKASQEIKNTLDLMKENEKKVDKLFNKIANTMVTNNHKSKAFLELVAAEVLRVLSIVLMGVVGYIIWETLYKTIQYSATGSNGIHWEYILSRFLFALFISIPITYLARESSKHRAQHYANHQIALNSDAIGPFISTMTDKADQDEIIKEMVKILFTNRDFSKNDDSSYPVTQELLLTVLKNIINNKDLTKLADTSKSKEKTESS